MLARTPNDELDAGPRKGGPGTRAAVRRHPRGEAGRRADPLRGRAGRRGARPQAQAAGPRPVGHGRRGRRSTDAVDAQRSSRAASSARSASRRSWSDQTERLLERSALDALAIAGKAGLVAAGFAKTEAAIARDTIVGLLHATGCRRRRRRQARRRAAGGATTPSRSRSSRLSRRPNWIWHWAGQMWYMQPCLPGLRATRFWRASRAWSAFGPATDAAGRAAPAANGTDRIRERE